MPRGTWSSPSLPMTNDTPISRERLEAHAHLRRGTAVNATSDILTGMTLITDRHRRIRADVADFREGRVSENPHQPRRFPY